MKIVNTRKELAIALEIERKQGNSIGFVPTMGALHAGHISLVERSAGENDITVVSIFVNPTQFNNAADLKNYPRTFEEDIIQLTRANAELLFAPPEKEMYPPGEETGEKFDFGNLENVMEGKFRPGHFRGVWMIVKKLFEAVGPDRAYFGEKDFQQLAVIRHMVKVTGIPVKIIACPTIREDDGLAMSSRNMRLHPEERREAAAISKALFWVREHWQNRDPEEVKRHARNMIESSGKIKVEYLELADETTLSPVISRDNKIKMRAFVAAHAGEIRLIDNISLHR